MNVNKLKVFFSYKIGCGSKRYVNCTISWICEDIEGNCLEAHT